MSQPFKFNISVIGHEKIEVNLPDGFTYLTREVDYELRQTIDLSYNFNSSGLAWSEYAAIFENYSFSPNSSDTVGLFHYRCVLNLANTPLNTLPFFLRRKILFNQIPFIEEKRGRILVGTPIEFPESLLTNFSYAHPEFVSILEAAAQIYDELNGNEIGYALNYLATNTSLVTRNVYIAPREFSDRWISMAFEIARRLDELFPQPKKDRWGGYILERLFSIYLTQEQNRKTYQVEHFPHLYFASTSMWIKIAVANARTGLVKLYKRIKKLI